MREDDQQHQQHGHQLDDEDDQHHHHHSKMTTTTTTVVVGGTDSDITSNCTDSSPPPALVYYVQSPSRESSEKTTTNSCHSSSPVGGLSPMHDTHSNSSSLGQNSSSTRFSGSLKPSTVGGTTTTTTTTGSSGSEKQSRTRGGGKYFSKGRWGKGSQCGGGRLVKGDRFDKIEEEEGLLLGEDDGSVNDGVTKRCRYVIGFVVGFTVLFTFFAVVLWCASRNQKPFIIMKSVRFENFVVQSGTDNNGVPTAMTTINATVKLIYHNRGTFFDVHVTFTPLNLYYRNLLILASGTIDRFYQERNSKRSVLVRLGGIGIPVYGGGTDLYTSEKVHANWAPVGLTLSFRVTSKAYVLGRLVKPRFRKEIICDLIMSYNKMNKPIPLINLCAYQ